MKKASINDVAKAAHVSKSTVSQYLNKRFNYMSTSTKEKIQRVIEELDYQPNYLARSLKQKRTSTVGVIVANILHTFSTEVIRAIEDYCHQHGFHVIVCNADDDSQKEKNYIEMLRAKQVDGLIVFPTGENVDVYEQLILENYPFIFMDRIGIKDQGTSVLLDNEKALMLAIELLIKEGMKEIGMVTTSVAEQVTPRLERIHGYRKVLADYDIPVNEDFIIHQELPRIKHALNKLFDMPSPPEALVAGNDLTLIEILEFCREEGIRIGKDIALIGVDDVPFAYAFQPTITTVSQPTFEMGRKAATLLLNQIEKKELHKGEMYRFEPQLVIRESSKRV